MGAWCTAGSASPATGTGAANGADGVQRGPASIVASGSCPLEPHAASTSNHMTSVAVPVTPVNVAAVSESASVPPVPR